MVDTTNNSFDMAWVKEAVDVETTVSIFVLDLIIDEIDADVIDFVTEIAFLRLITVDSVIDNKIK